MSARRTAALAPWVSSLHHYDIDGFPAGEHIGLPSTAVTLVIPVDEPLDLSMPQQGRRRFDMCLGGLHDGPVTIHHDGTQRGVHLALDPLRTRRLLGVPSSEVTARAVELGEVLGERSAATLADRVAEATEWPMRRRIVEEALLHQVERHERHHDVRPEVERAWTLLASSGGRARIGALARAVGWSARHLEHEFDAVVGLPPKTVARLMRFERSVPLVAHGHPLSLVAARCGYADQAHMTREWRRLAGTTPGRWMDRDVLANVQDGRGRGHQDRTHDLTT